MLPHSLRHWTTYRRLGSRGNHYPDIKAFLCLPSGIPVRPLSGQDEYPGLVLPNFNTTEFSKTGLRCWNVDIGADLGGNVCQCRCEENLSYADNSFYQAFECRSHPERAWSPTFPAGCNNVSASYYSMSSINIVADLIVLVLPLPVLSKIQLNSRRRCK